MYGSHILRVLYVGKEVGLLTYKPSSEDLGD
jgi:hypothetical protein